MMLENMLMFLADFEQHFQQTFSHSFSGQKVLIWLIAIKSDYHNSSVIICL